MANEVSQSVVCLVADQTAEGRPARARSGAENRESFRRRFGDIRGAIGGWDTGHCDEAGLRQVFKRAQRSFVELIPRKTRIPPHLLRYLGVDRLGSESGAGQNLLGF